MRLSTLLWIVTASCCFLAGHQWHRRDAILAGVSEMIVIGDGQYHLLTMEKRIPKVLIDDPSIAKLEPLSPHELLIFGLKPGVTDLFVHTDHKTMTRFQIEVPRPTSVVVNKTTKPRPTATAEFSGNL